MYINQSLSEQTLALFKTAGASQDGTEAPKTSLASSSVADQALKFALSKIALAARAGKPAAPVFEGAGTGIPEEGGTYGGRFSDPAQRAKIFAESYARQAASDAFQAENGYKNRLSMGLYTASSMAKAQQPGMGRYETREDAVAAAAERLGDMITAAKQANWARNTVTYPVDDSVIGAETDSGFIWSHAKLEDAELALAELSPEQLTRAEEKQAHDLAVTGMWYNIRASELTRDFGITVETSTSFDEDGRVTLNDFEVTHSKYGKIGEVKDGVFYIATTDGRLVDPEVYFGNAAAN
ncbi:hypothetical protein [Tritonibacter mobilis]|uniref:hypothetical protein n=1 Tax=Tritonibacter mobilis TaxID=379347 RepID=UPI0017E3F485|nr:hypothetical protein [Rhodobacteraceae bacterium G21628-S1]NKX30099.1 hypothetical protein [Rhodobacteraceae bacterium R_SAG6]